MSTSMGTHWSICIVALVVFQVIPTLVSSFVWRSPFILTSPRLSIFLDRMPPNEATITHKSVVADEVLHRMHSTDLGSFSERIEPRTDNRLRCAVLGCGMMGQEHVSYMMGYPEDLRVDFLCDPHPPSLEKTLQVIKAFRLDGDEAELPTFDPKPRIPTLLHDENELWELYASQIDLLVVATPNHLHTDILLRWATQDHLTILLEKPVAVSSDQLQRLRDFQATAECRAQIWVAMEYRFIPAVAKLLELIPSVVGQIGMCTIRENRYPFLHKIGGWNRDREKTGDTLVEKCCHFFDLMRLITDQEASLNKVRAMVQRGINYDQELILYETPIIDAAYVFMPFHPRPTDKHQITVDPMLSIHQPNDKRRFSTMACLELCMYAEGSRHQEEIIVTGTKGRLEAYLPENKVYAYLRPSHDEWKERSIPPPPSSISCQVYDCSDVRDIHGIENAIPTHVGYHYSSTAVEWYQLIRAVRHSQLAGVWKPLVSLEDGIRAVEIGLQATRTIVNEFQNSSFCAAETSDAMQ